ncbi:MAG: hypothetical protein VR65_06870 [Desulfobulbaceae bacterium BRH_c16a]|nr:MAG: hypothetical protein VR65_06870 [Desulfobulbaceae bacterium BRH_c16a]
MKTIEEVVGQNMKRFRISLVCMLALPAYVFAGNCLLENSVYEDADSHEFQLEFGPASGEGAQVSIPS